MSEVRAAGSPVDLDLERVAPEPAPAPRRSEGDGEAPATSPAVPSFNAGARRAEDALLTATRFGVPRPGIELSARGRRAEQSVGR
jgi:hypothetical protein